MNELLKTKGTTPKDIKYLRLPVSKLSSLALANREALFKHSSTHFKEVETLTGIPFDIPKLTDSDIFNALLESITPETDALKISHSRLNDRQIKLLAIVESLKKQNKSESFDFVDALSTKLKVKPKMDALTVSLN